MTQNHFVLIAALFLTLVGAPTARCANGRAADSKAAEKPVRALFITGGCCHDYTNQKNILTEGISARTDVEWTIVQEGDKREHKHSIYSKPDWAKGYDVIVHDECFGGVTDDGFVEAIVKVHAGGVPVVAIHCAVHSYRKAKTTAWSEMLGIRSLAHGPRGPIAVTYSDKHHPITQGLPDWTSNDDELYNNVRVYDHAKPLATGKQADAQAVVAWTNDFKGTRVFCTTLGHGNNTVSDAHYLDLVTRGLLWSVDKLDDAHLKRAGR